ncbi:hypothetical protein NFJ02_33g84520 [Pycnococcus provasolii]
MLMLCCGSTVDMAPPALPATLPAGRCAACAFCSSEKKALRVARGRAGGARAEHRGGLGDERRVARRLERGRHYKWRGMKKVSTGPTKK